MSVKEFTDICSEVFTYDKESAKLHIKFPEGCESCKSGIDWDCYHINDDGTEYFCNWRENYWKYDEVKMIYGLYKAQEGGLDLNRIATLSFSDFTKLAILKTILR